jgi:hypothetical protein
MMWPRLSKEFFDVAHLQAVSHPHGASANQNSFIPPNQQPLLFIALSTSIHP